MPSRAMLMFARKPARLPGRSWTFMLEALAFVAGGTPDGAPELPQHLALPRVEHLLGRWACLSCKRRMASQAAVSSSSAGTSGIFSRILRVSTVCLLSGLLAVGQVPGSGRLPRGHFLC